MYQALKLKKTPRNELLDLKEKKNKKLKINEIKNGFDTQRNDQKELNIKKITFF